MQPVSSVVYCTGGIGGGSSNMGGQRPFSRASIQRQSQVRGGGMGASQGIERGTRVACNGLQWVSHGPDNTQTALGI